MDETSGHNYSGPMRRAVMVLAVVLAVPGAAEAKLSRHEVRQAVTHWGEWMKNDGLAERYRVGRCRRASCVARLVGSPMGDCTSTVYVRRKTRRPQASEVIYRRKWVVGVTDNGMVCDGEL